LPQSQERNIYIALITIFEHRSVIAKTTGLTRGGHGKLIPIPPAGVEFDVVYEIELEFPSGLDRNRPPPAEEVRASISLTLLRPRFDERHLPEGIYQLRTDKETWQLQKIGASWELLGQR
jgi:hypothetical protein